MAAKTAALPPAQGGLVPALLRRDRVLVTGSVAALAVLSWAYTLNMAFDMSAMPHRMGLNIDYLAWAFVMWTVMMAAMMLPSALPMTLAYARYRRVGDRPGVAKSVASFVGGYLALWTAFSLAAALAQALLVQAAALAPMSSSIASKWGGAAILIGAGLYQFSPAKQACLRQCRTPFGFLATEWRDGTRGAFAMGLRHGAFCVGCCWALMAVLIVTGVMNILWVALLTLYTLIEKSAPFGARAARVAGAAMIGAGLAMAAF